MENNALEYPPAGDSSSTSMLATSSRLAPILPIKRPRSTDSEDGRRKRPRHEPQMINNLGISGNARVVNVGGDVIMQNNDGLAAETQVVLESIEQRLKVVHNKDMDKEVVGWLSAPDVSQNLNAALRKRQAGTGGWFLDGAQFQEWKETPNVVLCIYGAPGCGKTVLCSAIIEAVKAICTTRLSGWAYFFFDSRNANKSLQLYDNFLRSVLSQLSSRCGGTPEAVKSMYEAHGSGSEQPSIKALEETLQQVVGAFDDVYIMVDSLDESGDRIELLKWIETVSRWTSVRWHLLTTSRSEPDITSHLERISNMRKMYLRGTALDKDISIFVDDRLSLIIRWSEQIRALIKTTLVGGADGMFRWVAMQMDSLEHCLNVRAVREKLNTLPKDLEETYEQILAGSPHRHDLLHMLHWLAFSNRALRLEEIAEVPLVDFDALAGPCYDSDLKYSNPNIALTVCSGLVTVTDGIVKLAHFSVKEYLISDHIKTGTAAQFAMNQRLSHSVIAQTCVAYLLIFNRSDSITLPGGTTNPFPLHLYAAEQLSEHLRLSETNQSHALQELLLNLFIPTPRYEFALFNWVQMKNFDGRSGGFNSDDEVASPLYYASFFGQQHVVKRLLENGADADLQGGNNAALQAAAAKGHIEIVKLLLERGANANIQGGEYGTALQAAATYGRTEIVKSLLEGGARDVNVQRGHHSRTALQIAVANGYIEIVKLLLERGADTSIQGGEYGIALQAAADSGRTEIVKFLLERGADTNIQGGEYEAAFQAATANGYIEIVKLLLERGADTNIQGGEYGNALILQTAATYGRTEIVKLLLERGADADIQGGEFGTALQAAAANGRIEMVKFLFERGADANIQGGKYGTALQAAVTNGCIDTVKLLFERGFDTNTGKIKPALIGLKWS